MRDFFRGWRRKAGMATLVVALALTGMWYRSLMYFETCFWSVGTTQLGFASNYGQFSIGVAKHSDTTPFEYRSMTMKEPVHHSTGLWSFDFIGLDSLADTHRKSQPIIPYWSIVLPLTILSAYLLLSKRSPVKQTEPPTAAGIA